VVLVVRFVSGLRLLAGPLAGPLLFVPYAVGLGYAVGYGLGPLIERRLGSWPPPG